jgi:hypothetical protein
MKRVVWDLETIIHSGEIDFPTCFARQTVLHIFPLVSIKFIVKVVVHLTGGEQCPYATIQDLGIIMHFTDKHR